MAYTQLRILISDRHELKKLTPQNINSLSLSMATLSTGVGTVLMRKSLPYSSKIRHLQPLLKDGLLEVGCGMLKFLNSAPFYFKWLFTFV